MFKTLIAKAGRGHKAAQIRRDLEMLPDERPRDIGANYLDLYALTRGWR